MKFIKEHWSLLCTHIGKNKSELFMAFSLGGSIVAVVSAIKDTLKALKNIKEAKKKKSEETGVTEEEVRLTKLEVVKSSWKSYIPTFFLLVASIALGIASATSYRKSYAALTTAYTLAQGLAAEYTVFKSKASQLLGQEKYTELIGETKKEVKQAPMLKPTEYKKINVVNTGQGTDRFYIPFGPQRIFSHKDAVKEAINKLNMRLHDNTRVTLNDLYELLGAEQAAFEVGDSIGWDTDWCAYIKLHLDAMIDEEGYNWTIIDFYTPPRAFARN